jgi:hypothetical protein
MCRGDGTDELENILVNQKDSGFWVEIRWEHMVDSHFWCDDDDMLNRNISNGIKQGWGLLSVTKDEVPPKDKTIIRLITEEDNNEFDVFLIIEKEKEDQIETIVSELRREFIAYKESCFQDSKKPSIETLDEWFMDKFEGTDIKALQNIKTLSIWE